MPPVPELPSHLSGGTGNVIIPVSIRANGRWAFPEQMGAKEYSGFVYVIRDSVLRRFYLGKKFYRSGARATKGQESNWKTYVSSSNTLKLMFAERPIEEFDFIVLEQYKMRGAVSYAETWSLCHVEAPTTDEWYNKRIEEISWNVRENITQRHKDRLARVRAFDRFEE
jgi:hypothetical protein